MKNRYKLAIIIPSAIAGLLIAPFYVTNLYCDLFNPESGCNRIVGIGGIDYAYLPYFTDSLHTGNPNECWFKDSDGELKPCRIDTDPITWFPFMPQSQTAQTTDETSHFDENTIKVEGEMAYRICQIIQNNCPTFYPGIIQDDGSIVIEFVVSESEKITQYRFVIINDTLSYEENVIEQ